MMDILLLLILYMYVWYVSYPVWSAFLPLLAFFRNGITNHCVHNREDHFFTTCISNPSLKSYVTPKSSRNVFCGFTAFFLLWYGVLEGHVFQCNVRRTKWMPVGIYIQVFVIRSTVINKYIHYFNTRAKNRGR